MSRGERKEKVTVGVRCTLLPVYAMSALRQSWRKSETVERLARRTLGYTPAVGKCQTKSHGKDRRIKEAKEPATPTQPARGVE